MKRKHITRYLLAAGFAIAAFSCNKKLDIQPRQSIDAETALETPDDVDAAMVGAYSIMAGGPLYGTSLKMDADLLPQENYCSWRGTFTSFQQVARKTMNRDNGEAARVWVAAYQAINMANTVIDALDVVTDPAQKDQLEGEALFVRGIMHFELVRLFALPYDASGANSQLGVVIKTTATKTEAQAFEKLPRNTVAEVYSLVITDLLAAANKLPDDNGTRADRYTAISYLAKVYLQQGDFAKARDAADAVINSGKYRMQASVRAVFDNKNTDESIFEIQQNDQNNAGNSNDGMATFYASLPGIGRADVRMVATFLNTYDVNDLRLEEWYYEGTGARPGNLYCSKWRSFSQNLPVVRIAEMFLIRAECNVRLGTTIGATPAADLAEIRNPIRTNLASLAAPTLNQILAERVLELAFEGDRIHDIRRLKQTIFRFDTGGNIIDQFPWNDARLVFPIPQRDVDATEGVLIQNPGY